MLVYVVSAGSWEWNMVCGVFSTKESAEKYIKDNPLDNEGLYEIEEFVIIE